METVKKPTPAERKQAVNNLRKYHENVFKSIGDPEGIYIPKMAHYVTDLEGLHMGFFESELKNGNDIYTEMISKQLEPEDPNRTLYKLKDNPYFKEEYVVSEPFSNGHVRYYVPVTELEIIKIDSEETSEFNIIDPDQDARIEQITIRDLTAIMLKAPVSTKPWLNEIINKHG